MLKTTTVALLPLLALAGCQSPPKGQQNNRVEVTDTTAAERFDPRISITEMSEAADVVVQQLVQDLKQVPELNEYRSTVVFGNMINKTGNVPTTDLESMRTNIRARLLNSRSAMQNIRFIESKEKWAANRKRELDNTGDLLQEGKNAGSTPSRNLNEQYTFFLDQEMYRVERGQGAANYYQITFTLTRASDSEVVWSSLPYETKRVVR